MTTTLESQLKRKRTLIRKHQKELQDLLDSCTHPPERVVVESYYYPGGYYDKSYVECWKEFTLCGKAITPRVRDKNYCGSYG